MSTEKTIESSSAPRGRIYDRNYNLLVDNEAIKTIYYKKQKNIKAEDEIKLAYTISDNIDIDYSKITDNRLKTFYYEGHYKESRKKITDKEWDLYKKWYKEQQLKLYKWWIYGRYYEKKQEE